MAADQRSFAYQHQRDLDQAMLPSINPHRPAALSTPLSIDAAAMNLIAWLEVD
jgi:hypothetical protein